MALGVEAQALGPRERQEHGAAGHTREERRLPLDGEVLLAAEGAAGGDLGHPHGRLGEAEERGDLAPVVPGTLALGEEAEHGLAERLSGRLAGRGRGDRQAGLRLQERVVDGARREALADDVRRGRQRRGGIAAPHDRGLEEVAAGVHGRRAGLEGGERVGDGLLDLVLHVDEGGGGAGLAARARGHGRQHVPDVAGRLALGDEDGPVAGDEALDALAGDVRGGDDGHDPGGRRRARGVDPADDGPRVVAQAQRPVEHPRDGHIGDERLLAERHLPGADPVGPGAHAAAPGAGEPPAADADAPRHDLEAPGRPRWPFAPPDGRDLLDRVDHLDVAGAAAEVAGQGPGDLVAGRRRLAGQEPLGLHHDPRRAEPALAGARRDERVGPGGPRLIRQPFERDHLAAGDALGVAGAGDHGPAVHEDGARPAGALGGAAVLHRAQPETLPEQLQEARPGFHLARGRPAVQHEVHRATPVLQAGTNWPFR